MNLRLFFTEAPAYFYALPALLLAYGGAVIAMTFALFAKTPRREDFSAVDAENGGQGAAVGAPGVSVVIPFRNEERNLPALLASIDGQNYGGAVEVILVNDGSTDGGADVIKKFAPRGKNIFIEAVDLPQSADSDVKLTSKQRALDFGVDRSSYRLILFTDADMILEPTWAESMAESHLSTGADMVFGHTAIMRIGIDNAANAVANINVGINTNTDTDTDEGADTLSSRIRALIRKLFVLLESYQLEYLFSFAYAFSKLNIMGSCMGNNVLITKEAYAACGGQRGVGYSIVEDRALLGLVRKRGFKTAACEPFTVTARTYPSRSMGQFADQALRWARGGLRPGGGLFAAGLLLLTQNIIFLLSMICALPPALILQCAANFMLTWLFLSISFHKNGAAASKILFPAHYIFMTVETIAFLPLVLFKSGVKWKDRRV